MYIPTESRFYRKAAELKLEKLAQRHQPKPWKYVPKETRDDYLRMQQLRRKEDSKT